MKRFMMTAGVVLAMAFAPVAFAAGGGGGAGGGAGAGGAGAGASASTGGAGAIGGPSSSAVPAAWARRRLQWRSTVR